MSETMNMKTQVYKDIRVRLIERSYKGVKAKRFLLLPFTHTAMTNQNVWIPNKHLEQDGTIKPGEDIDYVFRKAQRQLKYAGYIGAIPGIKRASLPDTLTDKRLFD